MAFAFLSVIPGGNLLFFQLLQRFVMLFLIGSHALSVQLGKRFLQARNILHVDALLAAVDLP